MTVNKQQRYGRNRPNDLLKAQNVRRGEKSKDVLVISMSFQ